MSNLLQLVKYNGFDKLKDELSKQEGENAKHSFNTLIFDVYQVNYPCLMRAAIPPGFEFQKLVILVLHNNSLDNLPSHIGQLINLRYLDVSSNNLARITTKISFLQRVAYLNLSCNNLTRIPDLRNNTELIVLDLSNNNMENFPAIPFIALNLLRELKLDANKIKRIPASVGFLRALKIFTITNNQLCKVPLEVGWLDLEVIKLEENPFTDKILSEMVSTGNTERIIEYINTNCASDIATEVSAEVEEDSDDEEEEEPGPLIEFPLRYTKHIYSELASAARVYHIADAVDSRKYILCCVVKNVELTFLDCCRIYRLQSFLHLFCCDDRQLASIGFHDYDLLDKDNITYTTLEPKNIFFCPVGMDGDMYCAAEYFAFRKKAAAEFKKNNKLPSGFIRCLTMLKNQKKIPVLISDDRVFSMPPIVTTFEDYKVKQRTKNIFVEVTSQHSYTLCKAVMEVVLLKLCQLGICDAALNNGNMFDPRHYLHLAAVDIVNREGTFYHHFPSLDDLSNFRSDVKVTYMY